MLPVADICTKHWEVVIQLENILLDTLKIIPAEDDGTVFLGWVSTIQ